MKDKNIAGVINIVVDFKYWIGDLCYVMDNEQWYELCDMMCPDEHTCKVGEFTLSNGVKVSLQNTAYGDGEYYDQDGRSYGVDAGLIGVIKLSDISEQEGIEDGHIFEFQELPKTRYEDGFIIINNVIINTNGSEEDYDIERW